MAGAAALTLLLVVGVVVAVLAGGDDPAPSAGPADPVPTSSTSDPATTDPADPTATGPTEPETTAPVPVTPDTSGAVRGDIDGDGFGDLTLLSFDGLFVLSSDGTSSFGKPEVRRNRSGLTGMSGDVDGDGRLDLVRIQGSPPRMAATVSVAGSAVSPVATPDTPDVISSLDVQMALGDVDGDGDLDLAALTPLTKTKVQVDVALGDGTGRFAATTTWFAGDLFASEGRIALADVDGDGDADLFHNTTDRDSATPMGELLTSDGASFAVAGSAFTFDNGGYATNSVKVGDVDGDGADELVSFASYGPAINVLSYDGSTFEQPSWYDNSDTVDPVSITDWTISDVNGDGFDDIVTLGSDDNFDYVISGAFLSDGQTFTPALEWAGPLRVGDTTFGLLGPSVP
ncbi:FG-GAP repeat domain-containing protein [Nocardioides rubriscoriae]|uniref:FG-GAP repeat domain-containing protein n=1 Tax=Nocardioides rubriscoriae TaxID=642762 RepID=UPI0011E03329|nr:VCBS repeat-containing protein [Nocardioides rubriscoriae]